jgi:hypothetical protein
MACQRQNAVQVHPFPIDHLERTRVEEQEERFRRAHIRRERSAAYWFAAAKWGMMGMVISGAGVYMASIGSLPLVQEAIERAQAIEMAKSNMAQKEVLPPTP